MTIAAFDGPSASASVWKQFRDPLYIILHALWKILYPLEAELRQRGVVILPRTQVRAHMCTLLKMERPPWIGFLFRFCNFFVQTTAGALLLVALAIFGCVSLALGVLFNDTSLFLMSAALLGAPVLFTLFLSTLHTYEALGKTGAAARWEYFYLGKTVSAEIPGHVVARMRQVSGIQDIFFEEARFNKDPVVFACRKRWFSLNLERVPIGAYDTGTDLDRM